MASIFHAKGKAPRYEVPRDRHAAGLDDHMPASLDFAAHAGHLSGMSDPIEPRSKVDTVAPWRRDAQTALLFGFFVFIASSGVELLISVIQR